LISLYLCCNISLLWILLDLQWFLLYFLHGCNIYIYTHTYTYLYVYIYIYEQFCSFFGIFPPHFSSLLCVLAYLIHPGWACENRIFICSWFGISTISPLNRSFIRLLGPGMVAHVCNPTYIGGIDRRNMVWGQPRAKRWDLIQKNN
jgi:hypothetical protein